MPSQQRRITGSVVHARVAPGSKSDHIAVVLRTPRGAEYVLRRMGGNAFHDDVLEKLVGSNITASGFVADNTFIVNDWTVKSAS